MAHKVKQLAAQNRTEYLAAISKEKGIILFTVLKSSTYCSGILIIMKLRTGAQEEATLRHILQKHAPDFLFLPLTFTTSKDNRVFQITK